MKYIYMKDKTRVPRIAQKAYWNESLIPLGSSTLEHSANRKTETK